MSITICPWQNITVEPPPLKGNCITYKKYVRVSPTSGDKGLNESDLDDLKITLRETAKFMTLEIALNNMGTLQDNIIIGGDILKRIHEVLSLGCPKFNLGITLQLWFFSLETSNDAERETSKVTDFKQIRSSPSKLITWGYSARCTDLFKYLNSKGFRFKYELEVRSEMYIPLAEILQPIGNLYKTIYRNKYHCDFQLVSENHTVFPCHKDILCAHSTPLALLIENALQQELKISKMSDKSIEEFLKYLYYDDIGGAASSPDILADLLEAAVLFDIKPLADAMCHLIIWRGKRFVSRENLARLRSPITTIHEKYSNATLANRAETKLRPNTPPRSDLQFFIVKNSQPFVLKPPEFSINETLQMNLQYINDNVENPLFVFIQDTYKSLNKANTAENNKCLTLTLFNHKDGGSVQLQGASLEKLMNAVLAENGSPGPALELTLTFLANDDKCHKELNFELSWKKASEFKGNQIKAEDISDLAGRSSEVVYSFQLEGKHFDWSSFNEISCQVQISVTAKIIISVNHAAQWEWWPRLQRHLLTTGKYFDLAFVSSTGKKHFCHRTVVCVRADEIADKVHEYEEVEGIKLIPTDMNDTAITILLEFLYYNKLYEALDSPLFAWTLLMTAKHFRISSLWAAVSRIIKYQTNDWFNLKHAFLLYDAALQHPEKNGSEEIKCRIVKFLASKTSVLETNSTFNMAFKSHDSKQLFKSILQEVQ